MYILWFYGVCHIASMGVYIPVVSPVIDCCEPAIKWYMFRYEPLGLPVASALNWILLMSIPASEVSSTSAVGMLFVLISGTTTHVVPPSSLAYIAQELPPPVRMSTFTNGLVVKLEKSITCETSDLSVVASKVVRQALEASFVI